MTRNGSRDAYHHGDLRAALLLAGEAELAEKGVEGFTLRGCAKRAGVSHAAPAHHFGDADGLLTALAADGFRRFAEAMRARQAAAAGRGSASLEAAGLGYLDFARANGALFRLMFSSARPDFGDPELAQAGDEAFNLLARSVAEAREGKGWTDGVEEAADLAAAWSLAHGLASLLLAGRLDFLGDRFEPDRDSFLKQVLARLRLLAPTGGAEGG